MNFLTVLMIIVAAASVTSIIVNLFVTMDKLRVKAYCFRCIEKKSNSNEKDGRIFYALKLGTNERNARRAIDKLGIDTRECVMELDALKAWKLDKNDLTF